MLPYGGPAGSPAGGSVLAAGGGCSQIRHGGSSGDQCQTPPSPTTATGIIKVHLRQPGAGNLLNAILNPILIFLLGLGIGGAAIATVISEYLIAFILMWKLNTKVILIPPNIDAEEIVRYLKSGGLLIVRTIAVLITMTLSTSIAAREGSIPMAGHQICLQVWLAVSLLNDALALAGQAFLASVYMQGEL